MPYTLDDYQRESWEKALREMPIEKRLQGVSTEQLLSRLSADEIEAYLKKLKGESSTKEEST